MNLLSSCLFLFEHEKMLKDAKMDPFCSVYDYSIKEKMSTVANMS